MAGQSFHRLECHSHCQQAYCRTRVVRQVLRNRFSQSFSWQRSNLVSCQSRTLFARHRRAQLQATQRERSSNLRGATQARHRAPGTLKSSDALANIGLFADQSSNRHRFDRNLKTTPAFKRYCQPRGRVDRSRQLASVLTQFVAKRTLLLSRCGTQSISQTLQQL